MTSPPSGPGTVLPSGPPLRHWDYPRSRPPPLVLFPQLLEGGLLWAFLPLGLVGIPLRFRTLPSCRPPLPWRKSISPFRFPILAPSSAACLCRRWVCICTPSLALCLLTVTTRCLPSPMLWFFVVTCAGVVHLSRQAPCCAIAGQVLFVSCCDFALVCYSHLSLCHCVNSDQTPVVYAPCITPRTTTNPFPGSGLACTRVCVLFLCCSLFFTLLPGVCPFVWKCKIQSCIMSCPSQQARRNLVTAT